MRSVVIDGAAWFVAADVCRVLGLKRPGMATKAIPAEDKRKSDLPLGRGRKPILLNKHGLYRLVLRSDKPQARRFQDWVVKEVLPTKNVNRIHL